MQITDLHSSARLITHTQINTSMCALPCPLRALNLHRNEMLSLQMKHFLANELWQLLLCSFIGVILNEFKTGLK